MSIAVQSYPELYTMLLGWDLYDKLWNLLTQTGIAYLPFIGMILRNVVQSYVGHERHAGPYALRSMEVSLIATLLLVFFAVSPVLSVNPQAITYSPQCMKQGKIPTYHAGDTGTTYDTAFTLPTHEIQVPVWWYAVIAVSEGITNAANSMVGCVPNLRSMVTEVNMAQISDPELKQELQDFETMCYMPARKQFLDDHQQGHATQMDRIQQDIKKYGAEDTEWLGSHSFSDVYYHNLRATRPIPKFPYDTSQDINADTVQHQPPTAGTPSCYQWWTDSENGLRDRLYQTLPKSFFKDNKAYINSEKAHDGILKTLLTNVNGYANANTTVNDAGLSHVAESVGVWYHQLEEYPKLYAAQQAAPIIRAVILFLIYVFLPFALVFSSYRAISFVSAGIVIFSVIFWEFIFHLVQWLDSSLMQALYTNWFAKQGAGASLADMIIASLIILAPLFWFVFMGAMGMAIGNVVGGLSMGLNQMGNASGTKAMNAAKTATTLAKMV